MDGRWVFEDSKGNELDEPYIRFADGRKSIAYEGCDWRENPGDCVLHLTEDSCYNPKKHEIVSFEDGSDSYWYAIVNRRKV